MPKERVYIGTTKFHRSDLSSNLTEVETTPEFDYAWCVPFLEKLFRDAGPNVQTVPLTMYFVIGWGNETGHLQIGFEAVDQHTAERVSYYPAYFHALPWESTNAIIRELRHARDKSFGRPE